MKDWLDILIYEPARAEILDWPLDIKKDLGSILTKIQKGAEVGYPDIDSMRSVAAGCVEIRLKGPDGEHGVLVFHSFKKKSQKTPKHEIETAKKRLSAFMKELADEKD